MVVYDAEGYFVGPGIAELLANEGLETHLVTSLDVVSPISDLTLEGPMLRQHLHELGVTAHRGVTVLAVEPGLVSGEDEFEEPWSLETDGIVLVTQQVSDDAPVPRASRRPRCARGWPGSKPSIGSATAWRPG